LAGRSDGVRERADWLVDRAAAVNPDDDKSRGPRGSRGDPACFFAILASFVDRRD
jgi:hypothetical protein